MYLISSKLEDLIDIICFLNQNSFFLSLAKDISNWKKAVQFNKSSKYFCFGL